MNRPVSWSCSISRSLVGKHLSVAILCLPGLYVLAVQADRAAGVTLERFDLGLAFSSNEVVRWFPQRAAAWAHITEGTRAVLQLHDPPGSTEPEYALFSEQPLSDATLGFLAKPLILGVTHSLLVFLSFRSPRDYGCVEIETGKPSIRLVRIDNGIPSVISSVTCPDPPLVPGRYQRLKVEQDTATGTVAVYVGDMIHPALSVTDTFLPPGQVGLGSRNTVFSFSELRLIASAARAGTTP